MYERKGGRPRSEREPMAPHVKEVGFRRSDACGGVLRILLSCVADLS